MTSNGPERLIASADYGSGLRELKAETFSAERLAANWQGIEGGLVSPSSGSSGQETLSGGGGNSVLLKLTTSLLVVGGLIWGGSQLEVEPEPLAESVEAQSVAEPAETEAGTLSPEPTSARVHEPVVLEAPAAEQPIGDVDAPTGRAAPKVAVGIVEPPRPKPKPKPKAEPELKEAMLGGELAGYQRAKTMMEGGDYSGALEALEPLMAEQSALRPEARVLRARVLSLQGNHGEAAEAVRSLLRDSRLPGEKRAELQRFLGDVLATDGRCGPAILAYKKALELGVSSEAEQAIGRAIRTCGAD